MIILLCIHCIQKDKSFLIKAGRHLRTEKKQKENTSKTPLTLHSSRIKARETFSPFLTPIHHAESMNSSEHASYVIQDLLCITTSFFRQTTQNYPKHGFPNKSLHSLIQNHIVTASDDFSDHLILQVKTISKHLKVMLLPKSIRTKQFVGYKKG